MSRKEICNECNGSGLIPLSEDPTCDNHYFYMYCDICRGSGYFNDDDDDDDDY